MCIKISSQKYCTWWLAFQQKRSQLSSNLFYSLDFRHQLSTEEKLPKGCRLCNTFFWQWITQTSDSIYLGNFYDPVFLLISSMYLHINRNTESGVKRSKFIFVGCLTNTEKMRGKGKEFLILDVSMCCPQREHVNSIVNNHHLITMLSQVFLQVLSQQSFQIPFQITFLLIKSFFLKANIWIIFFLRNPTLSEMTLLNAMRD